MFLRSSGRKLPDLVVSLKGQVEIELVGRIGSTKAGGLRTTFAAVPDAPVRKFVLDLEGGGDGLLINGADLCKAPGKAKLTMIGQNGARMGRRAKLQTPCGSKARHRRHARQARMAGGVQ